ncbi:MAG TPA: superoxide dismutase [Planctomycetaceae bacterium]|nr:superoxide dismutase [Planctomycetaceae bacterium]
MMTRREALKAGAFAGAALAALPGVLDQTSRVALAADPPPKGPFTLPPLGYAYDALEPYIDGQTMQIHHDKHHAAYVANLNKAVADYPDVAKLSVEDILKDLNGVPEKIRTAVRNNGGGHFNHSLFWQMLKKGSGAPSGELATAIDSAFGGFAGFKQQFSKAATGQFGSGWAWLVIGADKKLAIEPTANQDSPASQGKHPLLGIDVWEHAYYLKYQNRRPEYIAAFFNVINWDYVADRYQKAVA